MAIPLLGIKHEDGFPDIKRLCPCDDCVQEIEAGHIAEINDVWPYVLPYLIRSGDQIKESIRSLPPCIICNGKIQAGQYIEVRYHVYAPLTRYDDIPFHHTKRMVMHNPCVIQVIDYYRHQIEYNPRNVSNQYMKKLELFMRGEPQFPALLASVVGYED